MPERHPFLRISIDLARYSRPLQLVHPKVQLPLAIVDLRRLAPAAQEGVVAAWRERERRRPFDWARPPLLRFTVHLRSDARFQLSLAEPFLDGWSVAILLSEVLGDYDAALHGAQADVREPAASFTEFVRLEAEAAEDRAHRDFWARELDGLSRRPLPRLGTTLAAGGHARLELPVTRDVLDGLRDVARRAGTRLKSVLLGVHLRVLARIGGSRDVVTGLLFSGRPEVPDGDRIIGVFNNVLPLRARLPDATAVALSRMAARREQALFPFRRYPLARLQRERGGNALFDTAFTFTHFHAYRSLENLRSLEVLSFEATDQTYFGLSAHFNLDVLSGDLMLLLDYDRARLEPAAARQIGETYRRALTLWAEEPEQVVRSECLAPPAAVATPRVLEGGPGRRPLLLERIASEWRGREDAIAAADARGCLTYAELQRRVAAVARRLRELGVASESRVAVSVPRGLALPVAILGILRAGGAFVPIDPADPPERARFLLESSGARWLLCGPNSPARRASSGAVLSCDGGGSSFPGLEPAGAPPRAHIAADQLAYVIYTSGTTGRPKGSAVSHAALANYTAFCADAYFRGDDAGAPAPVHTSLAFDLTLTSVLGALGAGQPIRLLPEGPGVEPLADALEEGGACGIVKLTPAHLRMLEQRAPGALARTAGLVVGGEPLHGQDLAALRAARPDLPVWNEYGPTETVVGCSVHSIAPGVPAGGAVPIGGPIPGASLQLLDELGDPVPAGVVGELAVGGVPVSRGYWNQPARTAQRFVPDGTGSEPGARVYRTGDDARRLADGSLEFLGRRDDQVKVRGVRVEPGEVASCLSGHPAVEHCEVVAQASGVGETRLVAYVTARGTAPAPRELRSFLRERLPSALVPGAFVVLDSLPLTPNGKVDRRALPRPEAADLLRAGSFAPPRTEPELILARLWQEALGLRRVGVHDDFFELGGDSLMSLQICARAGEHGLGISQRLLFRYPTIAELARRARTSPAPPTPEVPRGREDEPYRLTPLQEAMLYQSLAAPGEGIYVAQVGCELDGPLDLRAFEDAWREAMSRHEVLRTRFLADALPRPLQAPVRRVAFSVVCVDLRGLAGPRRPWQAIWDADRRRGFDVETPPLIRVTLARVASLRHRVLWSHHHLVLDGWSQEQLLREVVDAYAVRVGVRDVAPPVRPPFRRFVDWLEQQDVEAAKGAWRRYLAGHAAPPDPLDRTGERGVGSVCWEPPRATLQELGRRAQDMGITPAACVQGIWALALAHVGGTDDVLFGITVTTRPPEVPGSGQMLGVLINTVPVRARPAGALSLARWLSALQRERDAVRGFDHAPLDLIRRSSPLSARAPLFESIVVHESLPRVFSQRPLGAGLRACGITHRMRENLPLVLVVVPGDSPTFELRYERERVPAARAAELMDAFRAAFQRTLERPHTTVDSLRADLEATAEHTRDRRLREADRRARERLQRARRRRAGPETVERDP